MANEKAGKLEALRGKHAREERALIREALAEAGWKVGRAAAEALGVPLSSLKYLVDHDAELLAEWKKRRALALIEKVGAKMKHFRKLDADARRRLGA